MAKNSIGPWTVINLLGMILMIKGMFGMMEILDLEYSSVVFLAGIAITGISMFMVAVSIRKVEDINTRIDANLMKDNKNEDN